MKGIKQAKNAILAARTIVVCGHQNPDGDSLGSMLALGLALRQLGKRIMISLWPGFLIQ